MINSRFQSLLQQVRVLFARDGVPLTRAWLVILGITSVLVLVFFVLGSVLFVGIRDGELFVVETGGTETTELIDRTLLRGVLTSFEIRRQEHNELMRELPRLVDPSR